MMDHVDNSLPEGYVPVRTIDLTGSPTRFRLAAAAAALALLAAPAVFRIVPVVRPDWPQEDALRLVFGSWPRGSAAIVVGFSLLAALGLFAVLRLVVLVHEWIHGIAFRIFMGVQPEYGSINGFAFCAVPPGRFISRNRHIIALLAPLLVISATIFVLICLMPLVWVPWMALLLVLHSAASVGDLWIVVALLPGSSADYVWDAGATTIIYARGA